jgi:ubiquinone/menaquinone biosynthesis C-methylase UbiE
MERQVDPTHYDFQRYIGKERWNSFYHQIDEIISINPDSVLEVGVGSGLLGIVLKNLIHCNYKSIDIDEELKPDFVGSVLQMDFPDNQFDAVGCFEVLEHLSYEDCFQRALSEIFRVANKAVILSLPDAEKVLRLQIQIPKIFNQIIIRRPFQKNWNINLMENIIGKLIKKTTK